MRILEVLHPDAVLADLKATDKKGLLAELGEPVAASAGADLQDLIRVLLDREQLGSTGIGGGVGIPHGKLPGLTTLVLGFGLSRRGIDFESLDNRPTHIFFMLVTPENATGQHLKLLARISRLLKDDSFKDKLSASESAADIIRAIEAVDDDF